MGAFCFGGRKMDQVYGYVRVSTKEQNEARQIAAMRERAAKTGAGIEQSAREIMETVRQRGYEAVKEYSVPAGTGHFWPLFQK